MVKNKYDRVILGKDGNTAVVDVYRVLDAFEVADPCLQHLIKKALCAGLRGHKDITTDLQDIIDSALEAKELHEAKKKQREAVDFGSVRIAGTEIPVALL